MKAVPFDCLSRPGAFTALTIMLLAPAVARATVVEPDGTPVPVALTPNEVMTARNTNPLFPVVDLPTLFAARAEPINWQTDAQKKPDTFSPACSFSADLVLRGGGCQIDFGWYNVVPGHVPTDAEIFPLIQYSDIMSLPIPAFQPGAGEQIPSLHFESDTIRKDPRYRGGLIGFATRGRAATYCTQTHFSQQELNQLCTNCTRATDGNNHWIASVIWKSVVDPNGYYIGFEDLPMSATSFAGEGQYKNDGDMNDFVFFVSGVTCPGGGRPCAVPGAQGFCKQGVTWCVSGGALECRPYFKPEKEKCDAIDNDCDGQVDNGNMLCAAGQTCLRGRCVNPCGDLEFPCPKGLVCKMGLCIDPICAAKECAEGQICHLEQGLEGFVGVCGGPCDGVKCPIGQQCHIGRCVDLCAGVTCPSDRVCRDGACVPRCECLACDPKEACQQPSGKCVSAGCETKSCQAGQVCVAGNCIDACQDVVCPLDQACKQGQCLDAPPAANGGGSPPPGPRGTAGTGGSSSTGGSRGAGATPAGIDVDAGEGAPGPATARAASCKCDLRGRDVQTDTFGVSSGIAALTLVLLRRRRPQPLRRR